MKKVLCTIMTVLTVFFGATAPIFAEEVSYDTPSDEEIWDTQSQQLEEYSSTDNTSFERSNSNIGGSSLVSGIGIIFPIFFVLAGVVGFFQAKEKHNSYRDKQSKKDVCKQSSTTSYSYVRYSHDLRNNNSVSQDELSRRLMDDAAQSSAIDADFEEFYM